MSETSSIEKPTVLVVDDTPDNLTMINAVLCDTYKVKAANHGEKALRIANGGNPPDLILLDIVMPDMDGYEVCRRLKAVAATSDIPIIFLSGRSALEDEHTGMALGAVDHIAKPVCPPIVLSRVAAQLALKAGADFAKEREAFLREKQAFWSTHGQTGPTG